MKIGGALVEFEPMSPEERERMMQFLLHQQAQFAADFSNAQEEAARQREEAARQRDEAARQREEAARHHDEAMKRSVQVDQRLDQLADAVLGLTGVVGRVVDIQERSVARVNSLDSKMERLAEAQVRTEGHLDVVVTMFERHLREDHGVN